METTAALAKHFDKQIQPIVFDVLGALAIISQIQLASRHQLNTGSSKAIAMQIAKELQKSIAEVCPDFNETIERGWNPEFDVPV